VPWYWPDAQRDLFIAELKAKHGGVHRIETLCNLPVFWWLYRGDTFVPLSQTKRALGTWFEKTKRASWERSTHSAKELLTAFLPKLRVADQDEIMSEIALVTYHELFDAHALREHLRELAGPENIVTRGEEQLYLTDLAIGPIEAILHAREHLNRIQDGVFGFARAQLRASADQYAAIQGQLAADPEIGHLATPLTLDELANRACAHLAQMLGHLLKAADKLSPPPEEGHDVDADAA
jgi:hypothetical protein